MSMKKLWTLFYLCTIGLTGQQAQAQLTLGADSPHGEEETSISAACEVLINLENKNKLTFNEELVGLMVHEIIEQITVNPIDYCVVMSASIVEKDPNSK